MSKHRSKLGVTALICFCGSRIFEIARDCPKPTVRRYHFRCRECGRLLQIGEWTKAKRWFTPEGVQQW